MKSKQKNKFQFKKEDKDKFIITYNIKKKNIKQVRGIGSTIFKEIE